MTQVEKWDLHYDEVMQFMADKRRRPSKNIPEDRPLLNWIKYNKKLIARGELSDERMKRFDVLLKEADRLRRLNQYAYGRPNCENPALAKEQSLF